MKSNLKIAGVSDIVSAIEDASIYIIKIGLLTV